MIMFACSVSLHVHFPGFGNTQWAGLSSPWKTTRQKYGIHWMKDSHLGIVQGVHVSANHVIKNNVSMLIIISHNSALALKVKNNVHV